MLFSPQFVFVSVYTDRQLPLFHVVVLLLRSLLLVVMTFLLLRTKLCIFYAI